MRQAPSYGLDLLWAFLLASDRKSNSKSYGVIIGHGIEKPRS